MTTKTEQSLPIESHVGISSPLPQAFVFSDEDIVARLNGIIEQGQGVFLSAHAAARVGSLLAATASPVVGSTEGLTDLLYNDGERHYLNEVLEVLPDSMYDFLYAYINRLRLALSPPPVVIEGAGQADGWVPVASFEQINEGDTLLIYGAINLVKQHLFHNVQKKESQFDGQEVILKKKGNIYFNFGRFLDGKSWVEACYRLALPTPPQPQPEARN